MSHRLCLRDATLGGKADNSLRNRNLVTWSKLVSFGKHLEVWHWETQSQPQLLFCLVPTPTGILRELKQGAKQSSTSLRKAEVSSPPTAAGWGSMDFGQKLIFGSVTNVTVGARDTTKERSSGVQQWEKENEYQIQEQRWEGGWVFKVTANRQR